MKLSKSKIIGLIALLAVVGVVCGTLVWRQSQPAPAEPTEQVSITGYLAARKSACSMTPSSRRSPPSKALPSTIARPDRWP